MLFWVAVSGRLLAGMKSFDSLDLSANVLIPKYIPYVVPTRSPNKYSVTLKTHFRATANDDTVAKDLEVLLFKEFTASLIYKTKTH